MRRENPQVQLDIKDNWRYIGFTRYLKLNRKRMSFLSIKAMRHTIPPVSNS